VADRAADGASASDQQERDNNNGRRQGKALCWMPHADPPAFFSDQSTAVMIPLTGRADLIR
jgi:hypothetical protein